MQDVQHFRIQSITEYHRIMGLPAPQHPLISVINMLDVKRPVAHGAVSLIFDFYSISLKRDFKAKFRYGQQAYDFDEGVMFFIAPKQLFGIEYMEGQEHSPSGWMILIHPDFLWNTSLAKTISQYEYFSYSVHEALFVSEKEETMITGIAQYLEQEYHSNIDQFSQAVIIAQLGLLLTYANRFYKRQFITRKITNHEVLDRLEALLTDYLSDDTKTQKGLPTVQYIAEALHLSPGYLSELLKVLTGQSTQQHIHDKVLEKAKERLSTTALSVSEIAYSLGFEHSQSFSKFFKTKSSLSPLAFRQSFN